MSGADDAARVWPVFVTRSARRDLEALHAWIAADSPANAQRVRSRLEEAIFSLERMPARGRLAEENAFFGREIRQLLVRPYRVVYVMRAGVVVVIGVRHGARRPMSDD